MHPKQITEEQFTKRIAKLFTNCPHKTKAFYQAWIDRLPAARKHRIQAAIGPIETVNVDVTTTANTEPITIAVTHMQTEEQSITADMQAEETTVLVDNEEDRLSSQLFPMTEVSIDEAMEEASKDIVTETSC